MISVHEAEKLSLEQIDGFLRATEEVRFEASKRAEVYALDRTAAVPAGVLARQGRAARGLLRRYIGEDDGAEPGAGHAPDRPLRSQRAVPPGDDRRHRFPRRYTPADVELLAQVDEAHETLSGPATRRILQREFQEYGKREFQRLAAISNGASVQPAAQPALPRNGCSNYKRRGPRRQPSANGASRSRKAVPAICGWTPCIRATPPTAKACTTSTPSMKSRNGRSRRPCRRISRGLSGAGAGRHAGGSFPFVMHGFHSDNGSEFINQTVAQLLNKLLIEQTKSRPRHSNDNGLVETKNGAVIRKHIGWGHIACRPSRAASSSSTPPTSTPI